MGLEWCLGRGMEKGRETGGGTRDPCPVLRRGDLVRLGRRLKDLTEIYYSADEDY
jgi:hypothetical protein